VWSLKDAHAIFERLIGRLADWTPLSDLLAAYAVPAELKRSMKASAFGASLELVRAGAIELQQTAAFAPIYVRDRQHPAEASEDPR
jgi:segregation and condensation protein A